MKQMVTKKNRSTFEDIDGLYHYSAVTCKCLAKKGLIRVDSLYDALLVYPNLQSFIGLRIQYKLEVIGCIQAIWIHTSFIDYDVVVDG